MSVGSPFIIPKFTFLPAEKNLMKLKIVKNRGETAWMIVLLLVFVKAMELHSLSQSLIVGYLFMPQPETSRS